MKNVTLINNEWKEHKAPVLSEAERTLLKDTSEENKEQKKAIFDRIREESFVTVSADEAKIAQDLYNKHKIEGATLIAADIILPNGTGIINCRVDGEHKQIRF